MSGRLDQDGGAACQYRFRYRPQSAGQWTDLAWQGSVTTGQSFTQAVTGLAADTDYLFGVQARNSVGQSPWTQELPFKTAAGTPGPQIQLPQATTQSATQVSQQEATVSGKLDQDGGATCQYRFRYRPQSQSSWATTSWKGSATSGADLTHTVVALTAETIYVFQVQAKNSAGEGPWGREMSFRTLAPAGPGPGPGPQIPQVSVRPASQVQAQEATLIGHLDQDGGAPCEYRFRYRPQSELQP